MLKQYDALRKEQDYLRRRIHQIRSDLAALKETVVADTVTGSRKDLTIGPIKVIGPPTNEYQTVKARLRQKQKKYSLSLKKADALLMEIEESIDSIPDARIRMIIRLRYLDGRTWDQTSNYFHKSQDWARKTIDNYFLPDEKI